MAPSPASELWPPFEVNVDFSYAEFDTFLRVTQLVAPPGIWPSLGLPALILGGTACLAGSFLAQALHATRPRDPTLFLILMVAYVLGVSVELLGAAWLRRRARQSLREDERATGVSTKVRFTRRGVSVRRPASRVFHTWSAFTAVKVAGGLVLLFTEPGQVLAIPRRMLTSEQFARVVDALVFDESG